MSLKTSFFSKALVKSDFKRLWWIPALHTLIMFLTGVFPYIQRFYEHKSYRYTFTKNVEFQYSSIYEAIAPGFILSLFVPVLLAVFLFSYLQKNKPTTFAHSIPVSRGASFVSHCASGIIMFLIPLIINGAIFLIMRIDADFANTFYVSHLFLCLAMAALYSLISFSLATLVAMITGNVVSNIFFTYVFAILPFLIEVFGVFFATTQLYGYGVTTPSEWWCWQHLYLADGELLSIGGVSLYIVLSLIFLVGAFLLYRIRNLENHSEVVAFSVLRPVFVFGVAIVIGALGYAYIWALLGINNPWTMLPFGLIGLIIATMIVKKSFRRLKLLKPIAIYCAIIACAFFVFHFDLTGYESFVPDTDDIEYVTFQQVGVNESDRGWYYDSQGRMYAFDAVFSPDIKNPDEIGAVTRLHKMLTATEGAELRDSYPLKLSYKLKNGKTVNRQYLINYEEYKKYLEPIVTTDTVRKTYFPVLRNTDRKYLDVSVTDTRILDDSYSSDNASIVNEFVNALKLDVQNAHYDEYAGRSGSFVYVELWYTEPAHYEDGTPVKDSGYINSEIYYVRPSYKNTLAVLEKYEILQSAPQASDIVSVGVDYYGMAPQTRTTLQEKVYYGDKIMYPYIIESPEEIAEVYEYCCELRVANSIDMCVTFFLDDGHSFSCELNSNDKNLPECLKAVINP